MNKLITMFPGVIIQVTKVSNNGGYFDLGDSVTGEAITFPTVGFRFTVRGSTHPKGSISTNIVAEIVSQEGNVNGKFKTLSGSVYAWEVVGKIQKENWRTKVIDVYIPTEVVEAINKFKVKDDDRK